jgi:predicted dehydrogenase
MHRHHTLIIGCGSIGERHLRCFLQTKRTQVAGCDANRDLAARIGQTYGVTLEANWEEAVRSSRYTAVVICTPAPLHIRMARTALEAGLDVLIEKPLSHSLEGVAELIATRDRTRRQVAVAYVLHQTPALQAAREFIARGDFGPVRHATMVSGQPFHRLRPAYAQTYYRDRAMGGGAIQDALTHTANWIESVLGPTESLICDCAHLAVPNIIVEDTVHVAARHANALTSYSLNQFQAPNETTLQFNAAGGSVGVELHRQRWGHFAEGANAWTWHDAPIAERDTLFISQANAFLNLIESKPARTCSLEAAVHTLRFNLAALASAERGCRIRCSDIA